MEIDSKLFSLQKIVEQSQDAWCFNIPIYQRLYVWGSDQINLLLTDIANAYDRGEQHFFIGGTLMVEKTTEKDCNQRIRRFDLIDGQQRFTTLWLLSCVSAWGEVLAPFQSVKHENGLKPRIHFSIRHQVNIYLESMLEGSEVIPEESRDTKSLMHAQSTMRSFASKYRRSGGNPVDIEYLSGLAKFIYHRVKFVITTVPEGMDLSKLFEVINNRGMQLQHHDILKARLLQDISGEDQARYALLWNACADMSGFVERHLCAETGLEANHLGRLYLEGTLASPEVVHGTLVKKAQQDINSGGSNKLTLEHIFAGDGDDFEGLGADSTEDDEVWARSIIGFPLFLQHVLRIWLYKRKQEDLPRLLDRQLLGLFEQHFFTEADEQVRDANARSFVDLLWRMRVLWDEYIIKWVDQGEDEIHQICLTSSSETGGKRYINRSRENPSNQGLSLLQSMLYHSQEITTHYWLTPLLRFMERESRKVRADQPDLSRFFKYLCHLDNHLLGERSEEPLITRSRWFMDDPWRTSNSLAFEDELAIEKNSGTGFLHYWFYKVDFVLWYEQNENNLYRYWNRLRFTAKNSVEHISPQSPRKTDENVISEDNRDRFGNLVLVSRSINSEYSNLPFNEKLTRYSNKLENEKRPESLKMDLIYRNETWSDKKAERHHVAMLEAMRRHYAKDFSADDLNP
jgi:hypothetical protein